MDLPPRSQIVLETPRLFLRKLTWSDMDTMAVMLGHPEVMRYWGRVFTREEVTEWIDRQMRRYEEHGHAYWLAVERTSGAPIGQAGVLTIGIEGTPEPSLGYILHRAYWGRGYATEAAAACRDYVHAVLGQPRVTALIRPENEPSQRVARRIGMKPEGHTLYAGFDHLIFAMDLPYEPGSHEGVTR
jgi:RimJ/RimL family protein N-acetyltransferase